MAREEGLCLRVEGLVPGKQAVLPLARPAGSVSSYTLFKAPLALPPQLLRLLGVLCKWGQIQLSLTSTGSCLCSGACLSLLLFHRDKITLFFGNPALCRVGEMKYMGYGGPHSVCWLSGLHLDHSIELTSVFSSPAPAPGGWF